MKAKVIHKLSDIKLFTHIIFGVAMAIILISLREDAVRDLNSVLREMVIFIFCFGVWLHAWWRQGELLNSTALKKSDVLVFLVMRIFLLFTFVFGVRVYNASAEVSFEGLLLFFGTMTALVWLSILPMSSLLKPLYGKQRVLYRREIFTDLFGALILSGYTVVMIFMPAARSWQVQAVVLLLMLGIRPVAAALTQWKELPPPHRGGRRPDWRQQKGRPMQQRRRPAPRQQSDSRHKTAAPATTNANTNSREARSSENARPQPSSTDRSRGSRQRSANPRGRGAGSGQTHRQMQSRPQKQQAEAAAAPEKSNQKQTSARPKRSESKPDQPESPGRPAPLKPGPGPAPIAASPPGGPEARQDKEPEPTSSNKQSAPQRAPRPSAEKQTPEHSGAAQGHAPEEQESTPHPKYGRTPRKARV